MSEVPGGHGRASGHRPHLRRGAVVAALLTAVLTAACALAPTPGVATPPEHPPEVLLDEHFDSEELDEQVWNTCHWWDDGGCTIATNAELEWYRPEQVSIVDGALRLTAAQEPVQGADGRSYPFRSGMVTTGPPSYQEEAKLAWVYGSVEARVRVPAGRGLWPALWLLPASSASRPEIDILEVLGDDPARMTMHLHPEEGTGRSPAGEHRLVSGTFADDWHTIRLDWSPGSLVWSVDGEEVWRLADARVPDQPMYLVVNLAVGGDYPGPPDGTTVFPATYAIDHIRITGMT